MKSDEETASMLSLFSLSLNLKFRNDFFKTPNIYIQFRFIKTGLLIKISQ